MEPAPILPMQNSKSKNPCLETQQESYSSTEQRRGEVRFYYPYKYKVSILNKETRGEFRDFKVTIYSMC